MKEILGLFGSLTILGFLIALLYGWVLNIAALFHISMATVNIGELILRVAGIFVAPLGAIMGWFF